jgi:hypothetical protein
VEGLDIAHGRADDQLTWKNITMFPFRGAHFRPIDAGLLTDPLTLESGGVPNQSGSQPTKLGNRFVMAAPILLKPTNTSLSSLRTPLDSSDRMHAQPS